MVFRRFVRGVVEEETLQKISKNISTPINPIKSDYSIFFVSGSEQS